MLQLQLQLPREPRVSQFELDFEEKGESEETDVESIYLAFAAFGRASSLCSNINFAC